MLVKIVSAYEDFDPSLEIPMLIGKTASSYDDVNVCISDGNDDDIKKLSKYDVIVEKIPE